MCDPKANQFLPSMIRKAGRQTINSTMLSTMMSIISNNKNHRLSLGRFVNALKYITTHHHPIIISFPSPPLQFGVVVMHNLWLAINWIICGC